MKRNKEMFIDDNETSEDLLITDMTPEELDAEYERIFRKKQKKCNDKDSYTKSNKPMLFDFDDNETSESLHNAFVQIYGELTDKELDAEFERIFGKQEKKD